MSSLKHCTAFPELALTADLIVKKQVIKLHCSRSNSKGKHQMPTQISRKPKNLIDLKS